MNTKEMNRYRVIREANNLSVLRELRKDLSKIQDVVYALILEVEDELTNAKEELNNES